jgi:hypothetical protein
MTEGYIYCLTNEAMPGLVKIGEVHTEGRTPDDRARELYTTGVPLPFNVAFAKKVQNPVHEESRIHAFLNGDRVNPRREFFRKSPDDVRRLFDLIDGEIWVPNPVQEQPNEADEEEPVGRQGGKSYLNHVFTEGMRIRHVIGQDSNKTWIGTYNAATDRIICNTVSYTSLSDFAVRHHRIYNPERQAAPGWTECECEINGEWGIADLLRT